MLGAFFVAIGSFVGLMFGIIIGIQIERINSKDD